jgi:endogenous inhibitor of DNA gyrase (YacG/DUF329 family)
MKLISREKAIEKGLPRYFTGKPCNYGHISEYYVSCSRCCKCQKSWNSKRYTKIYKIKCKHCEKEFIRKRATNAKYCSFECKELLRNKNRRKYEKIIHGICKQCQTPFVDTAYSKKKKFCSTKCQQNNFRELPKEKAKFKDWYYNKGGKKICSDRRKKWYATPHGKSVEDAKRVRRRATQLNATPKWLTEKDKEKIRKIYAKCPKGYHVDHFIPLKGKNVCGLHVPNNLRIVTAHKNQSKGNRFDISHQRW